MGWDATKVQKWSTNVVWAINTSRQLRKELAQLGAIEQDMDTVRAALTKGGLSKFIADGSWTRGAAPETSEPMIYWKALSFTVWKDWGNEHLSTWIQHTLSEAVTNYVYQGKLGDMARSLLGIRWLLRRNIENHPLKSGKCWAH